MAPENLGVTRIPASFATLIHPDPAEFYKLMNSLLQEALWETFKILWCKNSYISITF